MPVGVARRFALVVVIALLFSSLLVFRPSRAGIWWQALYEWLHVPVFGLIALTLFLMVSASVAPWGRALLALLAALALAILCEGAQIPLGRSASAKDVAFDMIGATAFLLIALAVRQRFFLAVPLLVVAGAIVFWSAIPLIDTTSELVRRDARFPTIFDGDVEGGVRTIVPRNVRMNTRWDDRLGRIYAEIEFPPQQKPAIEVRNLEPNWQGYEALVVDLDVETDTPLSLTIRVHDRAHRRGDQQYSDRFNRIFELPVGPSEIRIALSDIEAAPRTRSMDMGDIEALIIFSAAADYLRVLRLYEIRLD